MVKKYTVAITTAADGSATARTPVVSGYLRAIAYVPHATTPIDTNGDVVITANTSGLAILTITNIGTTAFSVHPRAATVGVTNAASLYAAGGAAVNTEIPVADEAIKIVVADGADTKSGTFFVYVDGV